MAVRREELADRARLSHALRAGRAPHGKYWPYCLWAMTQAAGDVRLGMALVGACGGAVSSGAIRSKKVEPLCDAPHARQCAIL